MKSFQIGEALRKAGLRATAPRLAILAAIDGDRSHPSAEDVLARVRRARPGISFTTVYSTLEALVERGLLARVTSDPARVRFDTVLEEHDHLVCDGCGRIEDLPRKPETGRRRTEGKQEAGRRREEERAEAGSRTGEGARIAATGSKMRKGWTITRARTEYHGLCGECLPRGSEASRGVHGR